MACVIHWGPPGSYKSSSVVWFKILAALREGRVVVTNVEGMYPLEHIEDALGEKFPETAKLVRISSLKAKNRELWRRWFHWMPIGALVVIDEGQDVYPKSGWKEDDLAYMPVEYYSDFLPEWFVKFVRDTHISFKPELDDSSTDDTGEILFDKDGLIIYPQTMNESYKRHRKYNWDIIIATPDINDLHKQIRGACELAISYVNKDNFFRKRKPRLFEHDPTRKPQVTKNDVVYTHKVPLDVHLLYKSTQTGQTTKSGQASGALASKKVKFALFVVFPVALIVFLYNLYNVATKEDPRIAKPHPAGSSVSAQKSAVQGGNVVSNSNGVAVSPARVVVPDLFVMPFDSQKIYWVGRSCHTWQQGKIKNQVCDIIFELSVLDRHYQVHSDELEAMGYQIFSASYCYARLTDDRGNKKTVYCLPHQLPVEQSAVKLESSVLASAVPGENGDNTSEHKNNTAEQ